MAIERTITGVNDGENTFTGQSDGTTTSNTSTKLTRNTAHRDKAINLSLAEINELEEESGAQVYDTTNNVLRYWNGVEWKEVTSEGTVNDDILDNRIIVNQTNFLTTICGTIDSTKNYFLDGIVDIGANTVEVPATGLTLTGYSFDLSALISTADNATLFSSPVGGSGNLLLENLYLQASGVNAKVFDLVDATGFNAFEFNKINYINCTSLGTIDSYRQGLEIGTGRFGATPNLILKGNMVGGMRISTSITRQLAAGFTGALFEAGAGLLINGRFITDMNVVLPSGAALLDFAPANIANDESLIIKGAYVVKNGIDPTDTSTTPNITADSVKCLWADNTGIANTYKYAQQSITTEVTTDVAAALTYYPLAGTFATGDLSHFDSPANGQLRCLSGNDVYRISGNFVIESGANDQVGLRVTKSSDGGTNWVEINHIERVINNIQGGRDVGYFQIDFLARLADDDRIRVEVENYSDNTDITAEIDSYLIVSST